MSEMVERVARELAKLDAVDPDDTSGPTYGGGRYLHGSPAWMQNTEVARLVILIMREPTEEMLDAAGDTTALLDERESLRQDYHTMIDAALK